MLVQREISVWQAYHLCESSEKLKHSNLVKGTPHTPSLEKKQQH